MVRCVLASLEWLRVLQRVLALVAGSVLAACTAVDDQGVQRRPRQSLEAFCEAHVTGVGKVDIETDYLPRVVQCENGGASLPSLRAQAIAARSYLYYKLETSGAIADGESDQVYSCASYPTAEAALAVEETSGQILTYRGKTLCTFYVAGSRQVPPTCAGATSHYTERFVTHNWGLSGADIHQSPLGLMHPTNTRNRGCMSQWGSRCLADAGWAYLDILRFYYGADITLERASGPCIIASNQPPRGGLDAVACDSIEGWAQDADEPDTPVRVQLWFDGEPGSRDGQSVLVHASASFCEGEEPCPPRFSIRTPLGLRDGTAHSVHAIVLDTEGGLDTTLDGSPSSFRCGPPAPPLSTSEGVLRPVESMDVLNAWRFALLEDAVVFTSAEVGAYFRGPAWPHSPDWVLRQDGRMWLVDQETLRSVPHAEAWRIGLTSTRTWSPSDAAMPQASDLPDAPFVVRDEAGALYVLDRALTLQ